MKYLNFFYCLVLLSLMQGSTYSCSQETFKDACESFWCCYWCYDSSFEKNIRKRQQEEQERIALRQARVRRRVEAIYSIDLQSIEPVEPVFSGRSSADDTSAPAVNIHPEINTHQRRNSGADDSAAQITVANAEFLNLADFNPPHFVP
jgi:hypothetical protein